jgi:hypothetical protein
MDQTIYQITKTAALACSHLPTTASFGVADFLEKWQDLSGAIIGGLMGVTGAMLVAQTATRRERRIAARMILTDLMALRVCNDELDPVSCESLRDWNPSLPSLHGAALGPLSDVDEIISVHLTLCDRLHRELPQRLTEYEVCRDALKEKEHSIWLPVYVDKASDTVRNTWDLIVEHAALAEYRLEVSMFGRWPRWISLLRTRFMPNDFDRRSSHLIATGKILGKGDHTNDS